LRQAGHLDRRCADQQAGAGGEGEEVEAACRDVLAHVAGLHIEAGRVELIVQLSVDQVDLAQVGLGRVAGGAGAVLHGLAGVRVAFDAEAGDQADRESRRLAEAVGGDAVDGEDD
jgi:hypothetical protein